MSEATFPERIVMATDLGARSDRALARAAQLARTWHSELVVAHVVHPDEASRRDQLTSGMPAWRRPESWTQGLERRLREDLDAEGITARTRMVVGAAADALPRALDEEAAGLVVLGVARDVRADRIQLGSTVDAIVRHSRVPLLSVRHRVRGPYRHVVVASDFSDPSAEALRLAARWFERARLTLFHTTTRPGSTIPADDSARRAQHDIVAGHCDTWLADVALPAPAHEALERVIEEGAPEKLLPDFVTSTNADLVVMGSKGRSGLARALLGSTAEHLLHSLDCDTLVVRAT